MFPSLDGWFPWLELFFKGNIIRGNVRTEEHLSTSGAVPSGRKGCFRPIFGYFFLSYIFSMTLVKFSSYVWTSVSESTL